MWQRGDLAVRPGRQNSLVQAGRVPFVGLRGNPVAVVVTFLTIVRPMILRLMGGNHTPPHTFRVRAGFDHKKKKDRREWLRARLVDDASEGLTARSEEHTSELQSLMRISYAVFCLKKKKAKKETNHKTNRQ